MYAMAMKDETNQEQTPRWNFVAFFEDKTIAQASFLQAQLQLIEKGGVYEKQVAGSADQFYEELNLETLSKSVMSLKSITVKDTTLSMALIELQTISTIQL